MRKRTFLIWIVPLAITLSCAVALAVHEPDAARVTDRGARPVSSVQVELLERDVVDSATDWVSTADAVVMLRITGEQAVASLPSETGRGDGVQMVGRQVSATVIDIVWSRQELPAPLPHDFDMSALGWAELSDSAERAEVTAPDTSRLEVGETYVVGLRWYPAECEGDGGQGAWGSIGSGGIVPITDSMLGIGEVEGRNMTLTESQGHFASGSLRARVAGLGVAALAQQLRGASKNVGSGPQTPAACAR